MSVRRVMVRCAECAGIKPPSDLPPLVEPVKPGGFAHIADVAPRRHSALKPVVREWTPYRDADREEDR